MAYYGGAPPTGGPIRPPLFPGGPPNLEMDHFGNLMNLPRPPFGAMHLRGPPMQYGHGPGPNMRPMPPFEYGGQGMLPGPMMEQFNPDGMQPQNPHAYQGQPPTRDEPTKILRRPFDPVAAAPGQPKPSTNEIYDPSFPTSLNIHSNETRQDNFENQSGNFQPQQMQMAPNYEPRPGSVHPTQVQAPTSQDSGFRNFSNLPSAAASAGQVESKVRVMTGLVTQIQPGGFGMISEEIFFQQSAVTGDMPKVGDKVVVEAEAVNGMPFKYNAKKVTKLDADLVRDDSSSIKPTGSYNAPPNSNFGQLPESLNLNRRPATPPLKSILKRNPPPPPIISKSGEKSLRNDLISKSSTTTKSSYKAPIEDQFHRGPFEMNQPKSMELDIPPLRFVPPETVTEFPEFTYVTDNMLNLNNRKPSPRVEDRPRTRTPPEIIDFMELLNRNRQRSPSSQVQKDKSRDVSSKKSTQTRRKAVSKSPVRYNQERSVSRSSSPKMRHPSPSPKRRHPSPSRKNRSRSSTPNRKRKHSYSPKQRNRSRSRSSSSHRHRRASKHSDSRGRSRRSRSSSSGRRHRGSPRSTSRNRNRSRSSSVHRHRRKSRSTSRKRSRSSSLPRRVRPSPLPSPSRLHRRRSRSVTPPPRNNRGNRSTSRDGRNKSRSVSPPQRRNRSRSRSRERYRSRSPSDSRSRARNYSGDRRRRSRSSSKSDRSIPQTQSSGPQSTCIINGIVHTTGSSTLFPKMGDSKYDVGSSNRMREDWSGRNREADSSASSGKRPPLPIKFQITNPAASKPAPISSQLPNPSFIPTSQLKNSAFNITKTVINPAATTVEKKKKQKKQEPAFRVVPDPKKVTTEQPSKPEASEPRFLLIEEKIRQWEQERKTNTQTQVPDPNKTKPTKPSTFDTVTVSKPKPALDILQLKQTVLKDLRELKAKEVSVATKKPLANSINIEELKQTVQRDLSTLKDKPKEVANVNENPKPVPRPQEEKKSIDISAIKNTVSEGLQELRNKFNKKNEGTSSHDNAVENSRSSVTKGHIPLNSNRENKPNAGPEHSKDMNVNNRDRINKNPPRSRSPPASRGNNSSGRPRSNERHHNEGASMLEPVNEELERIKEEIHRQRFQEEENRLRAMGDEAGLHQLFYMEDRRRRRLEERQLTRLRQLEIQLKKEKNFAELNDLRRTWGPPHERYEHEKELRRRREEEEHQEAHLIGQAEAIRRHEEEYQEWLEDEAIARLRSAERASRGSEGLVLRRRTPSPSSSSGSRSQRMGSHRRRSRSRSYERYRDDWRQRGPRNRSPEMDYEAFIMRYRKGSPFMDDEFGPPPGFVPFPPTFRENPFPPAEHDAILIARAMDDVSRRQEELMQRELEISHRIGEMNDRRFPGPHTNDPRLRNRDPRGEYGRFAVPRH